MRASRQVASGLSEKFRRSNRIIPVEQIEKSMHELRRNESTWAKLNKNIVISVIIALHEIILFFRLYSSLKSFMYFRTCTFSYLQISRTSFQKKKKKITPTVFIRSWIFSIHVAVDDWIGMSR